MAKRPLSEEFQALAANPGAGRSTRRRATIDVSYVEQRNTSWPELVDSCLSDGPLPIAEIAHRATRMLDSFDPRVDQALALTRQAVLAGLRSGRLRRSLTGTADWPAGASRGGNEKKTDPKGLSKGKAVRQSQSAGSGTQEDGGGLLKSILRYVGLQKGKEEPSHATVHNKAAGGDRKRPVRGGSRGKKFG